MNRQENENAARAILGGGCLSMLIALAIALAIVMMSISLQSCKTIEVTKEVPVVTEKVTEHHHTDIVRDTLLMRDSIYHYVMGDTVIIERWHHTHDINKVYVTDTIRDTIPKVVTVTEVQTKEVNRLHWWQKVLMWIGGIMGAVGLLWIGTRLKRFV